jgi:hypothetical protein
LNASFLDAWIAKLEVVYTKYIHQTFACPQEKDLNVERLSGILRQKISTSFADEHKRRVFAVVVCCWANVLSSVDSKSLVLRRWPTDEIKRDFLTWFSVSESWSDDSFSFCSRWVSRRRHRILKPWPPA